LPLESITVRIDPELVPTCEAAARRRLRALGAAYPAVGAWSIGVQVRTGRDVQSGWRFEAHVGATIVGGGLFEADGEGRDAPCAVRLACAAIERQLQIESERARLSALAWLGRTRARADPPMDGAWN
jgi:hypothetical protein